MRRGERRDAGGPRPESPVPAGKASLEEPPDVPSAGRATGPGAGRRSTESEVYDDGTNTFFWRAHTLTVLFILTCTLGYVTLLEETPQDTAYNTKRGIVASILVFLCFGVTQAKDGPFSRPHPAYWRFWLCVSVVYELFLIFILFQTVQDGRQFLKYVDPKLGVPLPERDYGGNCLIYDPDNETDPFHNVWDKLDGFVPAHFLGWYLKTLMIRDWWMCMIISVMFEFLEYSLEHQLPNFSECWWDHWIMDVLVCNGLGIYCGMKTLEWLSLKTYKWQGLWNIPTYKDFRRAPKESSRRDDVFRERHVRRGAHLPSATSASPCRPPTPAPPDPAPPRERATRPRIRGLSSARRAPSESPTKAGVGEAWLQADTPLELLTSGRLADGRGPGDPEPDGRLPSRVSRTG
ncbi:hypothetical protein H8959_004321 [Pygathrix nigripes]